VGSQCNFPKSNAQFQKSKPNNKVYEFPNSSPKNINFSKNQKQSRQKPQSSHKNGKQFHLSKAFNKKFDHNEKLEKKVLNNRSLISQAEKEYFESSNKKKGMAKMSKELRNAWVEESHKRTNQHKEQQ
jgi:hypothetical protein